MHSGVKVFYVNIKNLLELKKMFFIVNVFHVKSVNQMQVTPLFCDGGVPLYLSNNLHFRSNHHKQALLGSEIFTSF